MLKKLALSASIILLTACGGGSDDDKDNGIDPGDFVSGTFQDASVTGHVFPTDRETHGYYGPACVDQNTYFQSARVRVYGSTAYSENDFKAMATLIEERLDGALGKMGLTWDELSQNDRPVFTVGATNLMLPYLMGDLSEAEPPGGNSNIDEGDAYDVWVTMTDEEKIAYADEVRARSEEEVAQYNDPNLKPIELQRLSQDFIIGCLSPEMGGSTFGEGPLAGVNMPPEYRQWPSSVGEIVTHEIVHTAQNNLSFDAGYGYLIPRWFTEGQAVVLAGQRVASPSEHYNYEPQTVVGFYDEYGDVGMAYEHYGLAYKYIHDHNSMESIVAMMRQMKDTLDNPFSPQSRVIREPSETDGGEMGDETMAFQLAFDANIVDHNGDPLTIDRFRNDYHDLMNAAY